MKNVYFVPNRGKKFGRGGIKKTDFTFLKNAVFFHQWQLLLLVIDRHSEEGSRHG